MLRNRGTCRAQASPRGPTRFAINGLGLCSSSPTGKRLALRCVSFPLVDQEHKTKRNPSQTATLGVAVRKGLELGLSAGQSRSAIKSIKNNKTRLTPRRRRRWASPRGEPGDLWVSVHLSL